MAMRLWAGHCLRIGRKLGLLPPVFVLLSALLLATPVQADPPYAALVMNAETGDILYARNSQMQRYPASLTKVMTLYILFEAIEDGRVAMDDELYVSRRADLQPASDLGVEEGSTITVHEAIQALAVRSANDVAVVIAEALSDSEWEFARAMTVRAQEMGMTQTRFENASGLPHVRQQTTARDLGILAMRIVQDFPQHMHYFSQRSFTYNDRTWTSHNHLLEDYEGTTGLKTGYIRASGFNLIATVDRDGHSLIGVVIGGRSAARRDTEMERILDLNFARLEDDPHYGSRVFSSNLRPVPRPNPDDWSPAVETEGMMMAGIIDVTTTPSIRPTPPLPAALAAIPSPSLRPELEPEPNPMGETGDLASLIMDDGMEAERSNEDQVALASSDMSGVGDTDATTPLMASFPQFYGEPLERSEWGVTIGTFEGADQADQNLRITAAALPTMLTWGMAALFPETGDGGVRFDAAFGPMTEDQAVDVCANLAREGHDCLPEQSLDWQGAMRR